MPNLRLQSIKPSGLPSSKEYTDAFRRAAQKSANASERDLQSTVRTWKHKPEFTVAVEESSREYSVVAGTDNDIYGYVDQGTKPHIIRARRAPFLRYRVGGRPKSRVNFIGSQAGSVGNEWRRSLFVLHPGTAARNFIKTIQKRRQKSFEQDVSHNLAKVARKQAA